MRITAIAFITLVFVLTGFSQTEGEVTALKTYVRKTPGMTGEIIQTVFKGEKITVKKTKALNDWLYISTSDGKITGWINKNAISLSTAEKTSQQTKTPIKSSPASVVTSPSPTPSLPAVKEEPPVKEEAPVEDNEVLRVETEEVSLNVRVIDSNNRSVNNLAQSQFQVYEDGILQPVISFVTAEVPIVNVLLIDNSRSLRSQLGKIAEAGKIIIEANKPKDESAVIRFISKDKIEVVQDFTADKNSLNNALDNLFVEGGQTAIIDAVYEAAKKAEQYKGSQKNEDVKLRALILVSDGDDRGSVHNEKELFDLLRGLQVQIYTIGFIENLSSQSEAASGNRQENAKNFLTRLSQETGGKSYFPASSEQLSQIASDISGELRTQYLISYSPTNEKRDGSFRKIKVLVNEGTNKEKRIAITRSGRTSAPK